MCFSLLHLTVDFRDLSQAEKNIIVTTSWANSPNDDFFHPGPFWMKTVIWKFPQLVSKIFFSSALDKSCETRVDWSKLEHM